MSNLKVLKKLIREEVRSAIQAELQALEQEKLQSNQPVQEQVEQQPTQQKYAPKQVNTYSAPANPLQEMLNQTKAGMSSEDYRHVISADSSMVQKPNFASSQASQMGMTSAQPGVDLSQLDFVKNAKKILDASYKKDQNKLS